MRIKLLIIILSIAALIVLIINYDKKVSKPTKDVPIAVNVARVVKKTMPYVLELAGTTEAYKSISVQSLVSGQVVKIYFDDGQNVHQGDLLYQVDDRDFRYQLAQAEANLLRDQIALLNAIKEEERYKALLAQRAVSLEEYEQILTNRDSLNASVMADNATIMNAKLQIERSKIVAPSNGKVGKTLVDEGSVVYNNSANTLVVINRISPIYITLSVPEQYLGAMLKSHNSNNLSVQIKTADGDIIGSGQVDFIDNSIDASTGTIKVRTLFPNLDESLWPGQFIKISLSLYDVTDALIVPDEAVQTNQKGQYVFVVSIDNKVELRPIEVEFSADGFSVAKSGLKEEEIVVTKGQLRLVSGSKVMAE